MKRAYALDTAPEASPMSDRTTSRIWRPELRRAAAAGGDVLANQFDRGVALTGYGLLITSVFTAGLPAIAALTLATAHSRDAHLITRTHYGYQIRIFWAGVVSFVLGLVAALAGAVYAFSWAWSWAAANIPQVSQMMSVLVLPGDRGQVAGALFVAAIILVVYGAAHTLLSSVWGAIKLVAGRPIGHIEAH